MTPPRRATMVIALAALAAVAATYFDARRIGFILDDYFVLRPRGWHELLGVWHGSWDPTGITPAFYRPLAAWTDAGAFALFGFNESALHALALLELAIGAWLIGEFVRREISSTWLGVYAAVLFAVHPAVSRSAGPFWYEQNHRLSVICVAASLLLWQRCRASLQWREWWPVFAMILMGSWFKEDVLLTALVLIVLQWWRATVVKDVPRPSLRFVVEVGAGLSVWFAIRWLLLGELAGTPIGGADGTVLDQLRHVVRGPWQTFVRILPMQGPIQPLHQAATAVLLLVSATGLWFARHTSSRATLLMGYGVASAFIFNLLVGIASSQTRYHLIALGAVVWLCGIAAAWSDDRRGAVSTPRRIAGTAAAVLLIVCFVFVSRATVDVVRPCTPGNLSADEQLRVWLANTSWRQSWVLPWLDQKAARCADGRYLPVADAIPDVLRIVREGRP